MFAAIPKFVLMTLCLALPLALPVGQRAQAKANAAVRLDLQLVDQEQRYVVAYLLRDSPAAKQGDALNVGDRLRLRQVRRKPAAAAQNPKDGPSSEAGSQAEAAAHKAPMVEARVVSRVGDRLRLYVYFNVSAMAEEQIWQVTQRRSPQLAQRQGRRTSADHLDGICPTWLGLQPGGLLAARDQPGLCVAHEAAHTQIDVRQGGASARLASWQRHWRAAWTQGGQGERPWALRVQRSFGRFGGQVSTGDGDRDVLAAWDLRAAAIHLQLWQSANSQLAVSPRITALRYGSGNDHRQITSGAHWRLRWARSWQSALSYLPAWRHQRGGYRWQRPAQAELVLAGTPWSPTQPVYTRLRWRGSSALATGGNSQNSLVIGLGGDGQYAAMRVGLELWYADGATVGPADSGQWAPRLGWQAQVGDAARHWQIQLHYEYGRNGLDGDPEDPRAWQAWRLGLAGRY